MLYIRRIYFTQVVLIRYLDEKGVNVQSEWENVNTFFLRMSHFVEYKQPKTNLHILRDMLRTFFFFSEPKSMNSEWNIWFVKWI